MRAALYDRIGSAAFSLSIRVVSDTRAAEEAVVAAFAVLPDSRAAEDGASATRTLLAVRRKAFEQRRAGRGGPASVRDPLSTDLPEPASGRIVSTLNDTQHDRLRLAFDTLPPQAREAIELMFFDGLTEHELVGRLGSSADVIRRHIHDGLAALREATVATP